MEIRLARHKERGAPFGLTKNRAEKSGQAWGARAGQHDLDTACSQRGYYSPSEKVAARGKNAFWMWEPTATCCANPSYSPLPDCWPRNKPRPVV